MLMVAEQDEGDELSSFTEHDQTARDTNYSHYTPPPPNLG